MGQARPGPEPWQDADQRRLDVLQPGDVIYVDPLFGKDGNAIEGQFRLRQLPEVSGAMVVMDPWTGRVLAMVGGFSFDQSQFNRATQAYRQPGSSFKPLVYSTALDNGYTPSTVVVDAPIEIDQGQGAGVWRPENYSTGKYYGPVTLRVALQRSLNTVTVRLAQDIGMPLIGEYAKRFGVYDELPNYLSYALGAGETTVMRMVTAYSMFANGGRRVKSTLIDRIQDRYGHTIFKHDQRECRGCDAPGGWKNQNEPQLVDRREQVLDAMTAYQITSMMEGVVQARYGDHPQGSRQADRRQDRHHQRRKGRLVHRLLAGHRGRRLYRLRQAAPPRQGRDRRPSGGSDREGLPQARARRQAADSVQGAGRHQAGARRRQERHARRLRMTAAAPSWKPSSPAPRRRIITPRLASSRGSLAPHRPMIGAAGCRQHHAAGHRQALLASRAAEVRRLPSAVSAATSPLTLQFKRPEKSCAPKSNALSKRSSSQSGC